MLIHDFRTIGNKLLDVRKKNGLTQVEVAELAGLSDRTYADIERGTVNMRIETILRVCAALHITPDDILTDDMPYEPAELTELIERLKACPTKEQETALRLLQVYLDSLQ